MKGYFTSLIRQTGITFGTRADYPVSDQMPRMTGSKTREYPTPIHVEEKKLVEPQADQAPQKLPDGTGEDSQGSILDIREGNIVHLKGEGFESESSKKPRRDTSHREEPPGIGLETTKSYQQTIEPLKSGSNDRDDLTSSGKCRSQNKIGSKKLSKKNEEAATANQAFDEDPVFKPATKSGDAIDKKQAWSSRLKEVKEWVAGTPVPGSKELLKSKEGKGENMHERAPTFLGEKQRQGPVLPFPGPTESQQRAEPKVRDYHLSIGTISLTVEGPQEDSRREKPPETERGSAPGREADGSRLSRHYIRI